MSKAADDGIEDEVLAGLLVARLHEYHCQGHLSGTTDETIEFTVTRQP